MKYPALCASEVYMYFCTIWIFVCVFRWNLDVKCTYQRQYLIINHIGAIRAEHDDFVIRFASSMNQVLFPPHPYVKQKGLAIPDVSISKVRNVSLRFCLCSCCH